MVRDYEVITFRQRKGKKGCPSFLGHPWNVYTYISTIIKITIQSLGQFTIELNEGFKKRFRIQYEINKKKDYFILEVILVHLFT